MDLELGSSVGVDVATLALIPILWVRMQRWNQIQSTYKKGVTMMGAVLLLVHVFLCIREFRKSEFYKKNYQLGLKMMERAAFLGFAVLFMFVARACGRIRKNKSAKMITGAIITLVCVAIFIRKSTVEYMPPMPTPTYSSSPFESSIIRSKTFDVRKIVTKVFIFLFVSICASVGI